MKTISPSLSKSLLALTLVAAAWYTPTDPTPHPVYCPPGYYWNGVTCLEQPGVLQPTPNFYQPTHPVYCPPGYYWNGVTCLENPYPTPTLAPPIIWPTPIVWPR